MTNDQNPSTKEFLTPKSQVEKLAQPKSIDHWSFWGTASVIVWE